MLHIKLKIKILSSSLLISFILIFAQEKLIIKNCQKSKLNAETRREDYEITVKMHVCAQ